MDKWVNLDDCFEKIQTDLYLSGLHEGKQKVDAFLTQSEKTLVTCEGLFSFLKYFTAHIDQFNPFLSVSIKEASDTLRNQKNFFPGIALNIPDVQKIFESRI